MLKNQRQIRELQRAGTSKKIAAEFLEKYYRRLDELAEIFKKEEPTSEISKR